MSNTQVTLCPLEAGVKLEYKIWVAFWLAGQTDEYTDISLKEVQVIWALLVPHEKPHLFVIRSEI